MRRYEAVASPDSAQATYSPLSSTSPSGPWDTFAARRGVHMRHAVHLPEEPMRCAGTLLAAPLLLAGLGAGIVAQDRPYTEGPVVNLSTSGSSQACSTST